jgi:hypothetical protein
MSRDSLTQARPHRVNWVKVISAWVGVIAILSAIGTGVAWVLASLESRIVEAINEHDHGYPTPAPKESASHNNMCEEIDQIKMRVVKSEALDRANYSDLKKAYWNLIGLVAADVEQHRELRAAAASFYRAQFLELTDRPCIEIHPQRCRPDGKPYMEDVYRMALQVPWSDRPSLVRSLRLR